MAEQSSSSEEDEGQEEAAVTTPRHEPAVIAKSQADAIYKLIQDLKDEGHLAKRRLHLDLLTERLSDRYSFSSEDTRKIIAIRADAVLQMLDEDDSTRWSRYVIHRELTHASKNASNTTVPPALLTPLQPLDDSDDGEHLGRSQKSVLRPKTASVSNKLMGKRNRNTAVSQQAEQSNHDNDDDEDNTQMEDDDTPSKSRGHELIRTPLASAKQRKPDPSNKQSVAASLLKSVLSSEAPQTPSTTAPSANHWTSDLSLGHSGHETKAWTCRMSGCSKVITSRGDQRKKEIEDHAGEHDWEVQMRVELVESERRMHSTLPVSNLMKYLVDQHLQQKRTAFPELYPMENGTGNGNANGIVESSNAEDLAPTPNHQQSTEENPQSVNGHAA